MKTLKKLVAKHWALIGLIVAFIVEHTFDILKNSGLSLTEVDLIKGLGVIITGYFWNPKTPSVNKMKTSSASKKGSGAIIPSKGL
jgi:hypothetical protein